MPLSEILIYAILGLQIFVLILIGLLWRRQSSGAVAAFKGSAETLQKGQDRLEALLRDEMAGNRREAGEQARVAREETGASASKIIEQFAGLQRDNLAFRERLAERLNVNFGEFSKALVGRVESAGNANKEEAALLRGELFKLFNEFGIALTRQMSDATTAQDRRFEQFERRLVDMGERSADQIHSMDDSISERLDAMLREAGQNWDAKRADDTAATAAARLELHEALERLAEAVARNFAGAGEAQRGQFDSFIARMDALAASADTRAETLRGVVDNRLQLLQDDNSQKLEAMRRTVDEKLDGTLNERLGERFRTVSERLELVHAEMGEMQLLASGVGDLKRVLSEVKTRGNWGEIQLGALLDQMLTPQQYARNVATIPNSEARVDYAVRLPGPDKAQDAVWLPIDAQISQQDYARIVEAQESGDRETIEAAAQELENRVKARAAEISRDFVRTPYTTDFAILFLPTEGLYAEVVRRAGLVETLQREFRVTIAGPATLTSVLNALQMGFATLAIQERSREVWDTLGAVKTEFGKYGEVLDAVQKKLHEASVRIDQTRKRSRAIERQLRDVEVPADPAATPSLPRLVTDEDEEAEREDVA